MSFLFAASLFAGYAAGSTYASVSTNGPRGNDDYVNSIVNLYGSVGIAPGTSNALLAKLPSAQTEFWVGFDYSSATTSAQTLSIMGIEIAGGNKSFALYLNASVPGLRWWNGSSWTVLSGVSQRRNYNLQGQFTNRFDVHVKLDNSAGFIKVYRYGMLILEFNGDTIENGVSTVDQIRFTGVDSNSSYGEVIIATHRTVGLRLCTLSVASAGSVTGWTSGTFASIDEETQSLASSDADYIESGTVDQVLTVNVDSLGVTTLPVQAVAVNVRGLYTGAAPQGFNALVRMASTDYHAADGALGTTAQGFCDLWATNPNTSLPWTTTDITNLEAGVRSRT